MLPARIQKWRDSLRVKWKEHRVRAQVKHYPAWPNRFRKSRIRYSVTTSPEAILDWRRQRVAEKMLPVPSPFADIDVFFKPSSVGKPTYRVLINLGLLGDPYHEMGHARQVIYHFEKGKQLRSFGSLAEFSEIWLRHLELGLPEENPFLVSMKKRKLRSFDTIRNRALYRTGNTFSWLFELSKYFSTRKMLLKAIAAMYREPSMEPTIRELTSLALFSDRSASLRLKMIDFFEKYLKNVRRRAEN